MHGNLNSGNLNGEKQLPVSSSNPPQFDPDQQALFREVLQLLTEENIPFVVSGAFALQAHTGICRDTKDLDLFMPTKDAQRALHVLTDHGYRCEVTDPVWLAKAQRGDFFVDLITGMSNGVVSVDSTWIERGTPANVFGVPVRILAPEELILSKIFVTRRERFDGADIAHVIYGTHGNLDWNWLLESVGEHWEVLYWMLVLFHYAYPAHADYVPRRIWDDLISRFQSAVHNPNGNTGFRGSLIDPLMFAIDVDEWGMRDLNEEYRLSRQPKLTEARQEPAA
ncbi:MAG TPA: nucleotidyltransferase [Terriglobales bacterium]|nr:nucleotidyltransferase [Terriglobales bacterium]